MHVRNWAVGLFVVLGFGLLTALLFLIGDRQKAFSKHLELRTEFADLNGLANGAKVRVSGIDAGKIKKIEIPKSAAAKFRLELEVEEKVHGMIRKDSVVSIETDGVVGDKFVLIKRGGERSEEAPAGTLLPSKEPVDLSALMDRASGLLNDVHGSVTDIRGRVDGVLTTLNRTVDHTDGLITDIRPNISKMARDGSQITGQISSLTSDVNQGKGSVGMLLRDETTRQQLQATLSNVKETSASIDEASGRANQVIADFQSRQLTEKAQATLENVEAISQQLDSTVKAALAQDNMGQDGGANLQQTLSNLNRSTTNLAEDTEALKHNFFFRGFFKRRGFFNLDQITPDEYVQACDRHKNMGSRTWLQASAFVRSDANGQEQLTEAGRDQIVAESAPLAKSLPEHLIVVEGYATEGSSDRQFVVSRRRADLVRRYLEVHYHLRHSDIGVVPLGHTLPQSAGRNDWDGVAIMLLDLKSK